MKKLKMFLKQIIYISYFQVLFVGVVVTLEKNFLIEFLSGVDVDEVLLQLYRLAELGVRGWVGEASYLEFRRRGVCGCWVDWFGDRGVVSSEVFSICSLGDNSKFTSSLFCSGHLPVLSSFCLRIFVNQSRFSFIFFFVVETLAKWGASPSMTKLGKFNVGIDELASVDFKFMSVRVNGDFVVLRLSLSSRIILKLQADCELEAISSADNPRL